MRPKHWKFNYHGPANRTEATAVTQIVETEGMKGGGGEKRARFEV